MSAGSARSFKAEDAKASEKVKEELTCWQFEHVGGEVTARYVMSTHSSC